MKRTPCAEPPSLIPAAAVGGSRDHAPRLPAGILVICVFLLLLSTVFAQHEDDPGAAPAHGPSSPEGDYLHARKLYERGMYDFAAAEFEQFLREYPGQEHAGEAALFLAESLRAQRMFQEARNTYVRASVYLTDSTRTVEALHKAAEMDLLLGDTARAVDRYLAVEILYPGAESVPRTLLRAGRLQIEAGWWQEAERTLAALLRDFPGTEWEQDANLLLAQSFAGQNDLEAAIQSARGVARNTNDDSLKVRAGIFVGRWELERHNPAAAIQVWTAVLQGMGPAPGASVVAAELADLYLRLGKMDEAAASLERASQLTPDSTQLARIELNRGDILLQQQKYEKARSHYSSAGSERVLLREGWCLSQSGKTDSAMSVLKRATEASDVNWAAALALGDLEAQRDSLSDAALSYLEAIRAASAPDLRELIRFHAASALKELQPERALRLLQATESATPVASPVADDLVWMEAGLLFETGEFKASADRYQQLAHEFPAGEFAVGASRRTLDLHNLFVVTDDDPQHLSGMLQKLLLTPADPAVALELAGYLERDLKQFDAAATLLRSLMQQQNLTDQTLGEARELYIETVWKQWRKQALVDGFDPDGHDPSLRESAAGTIRMLDTALGPSWLAAEARVNHIYNQLRFAGAESISERIHLQRSFLNAFLQLYPENDFAAQARFDLAEALLTRLPDDTSSGDSLAMDYLRQLSLADDTRLQAASRSLLYHRLRAMGDATAADSLADVILAGLDSPEKAEAALDIIENSSGSARSTVACSWLLDKAWYSKLVLDNAAMICDVWFTRNSPMSSSGITPHDLIRWIATLDPASPAAVYPRFVTGDALFVRARIAEADGDTLSAIEDYTACLNSGSGSIDKTSIAIQLGRLYDVDGQWDNALPWYQLALRQSPANPDLQQIRRKLAMWAFDGGRNTEAYEWLRGASQNEFNPDTAFALDELAIVSLCRDGKLDKAQSEVKTFSSLYKNRPGREDALARYELERGRYFSSQEKYNDALNSYKEVTGKYKNTRWEPEARYEIARDYLEQGEDDKAYEMLTELAKADPDHPIMGKVYWLLGNYYASKGNYFDAFQKYEAVLADTTYRGSWRYVLGNEVRAFKEAGFYEGAMRAARMYLEMYPDAPDAFDQRMNLALSYHETGNYDLAISQFRRAMVLADGEDYPACQYYIAEALERSGRLKEAVSQYMRVVNLNRPTKLKWGITALYNAAKLLERLGQPDRAKSLYREIVAKEGLGSPFGRRAQEQVQRLEMFSSDERAGGGR